MILFSLPLHFAAPLVTWVQKLLAKNIYAFLLQILAGALLAFAFAPYNYLLCLLAAISIAFWQFERGVSLQHRLLMMGGFFFGFFTLSLSWIVNALFVEGSSFLAMVPLALFGLPLLLTLISLLGGSVFWFFVTRCESYTGRLLLFVLGFSFSEYLRGHILTGFPWNLMGYVWAGFGGHDHLAILQNASWGGIYGLSLLTILWALLPAAMMRAARQKTRPLLFLVAAGLLSFGLSWGYGAARLEKPRLVNPQTAQNILIVQPNIPQSFKWATEKRLENLKQHIQQSQLYKTVPDIILWPETALAFDLTKDKELRDYIARFLPKGSLLITGVPRSEVGKEGDENQEARDQNNDAQPRLYNSLVVMNHHGVVETIYDKHHLVPFGEYVPLEKWLPLEKIVAGFASFSEGSLPAPQNIITKSGSGRILPLICYEAIFPSLAGDAGAADWLVNVTNDAWYGDSAGPYQHLQIARLRAIEQGRPLLRAANTGISAAIDEKGRILDSLSLNQAGNLEISLSFQSVISTTYARWRESIYFAIVTILTLLVVIFSKNKRFN